jgi:hypothetical protein
MRAVFFLAFLMACSGLAQSAPAPVASGMARETPECFNTALGRVDCVARDRVGRLVWTTLSRGAWSKPAVLTGRMAGPPSCVVRGPGGMNCFAVRPDGAMAHVAMNGGRWRQASALGGDLAASRPACVAPARDQIVCYVRTQRQTLAMKAWLGDSIWQPWRDLGGNVFSDPSCVRLGFGRAGCFWLRGDGLLSGWLPADKGPGGAVLTMPRSFGEPSCTAVSGDNVICATRDGQGHLVEWRGSATLGRAGRDGFRGSTIELGSALACSASRGRTICAAAFPAQGQVKTWTAAGPGWREASVALPDAIAARCVALDTLRDMCVAVTRTGDLRAAIPGAPVELPPAEIAAAAPAPPVVPLSPVAPAAPAVVAAVVVPLAAAPAAIAPVSTQEPAGPWHVFEPRTGLHCEITLFDAPARPYRSLGRTAACARLASLQGVDRWSAERGGIFLRDRRGRVFFRFFAAGPTALRAQWRRRDMIMMARDPRAFQGKPAGSAASPAPDVSADVPRQTTLRDAVGAWQLTTGGTRACTLRLAIDPDTATGRARTQGCRGGLALIDSWSLDEGILTLSGDGRTYVRLSPKGGDWQGRSRGSRAVIELSRP